MGSSTRVGPGRRGRPAGGVAVALLVLVSACTGGSSDQATAGGPRDGTGSAGPAAASTAPAAPAARIVLNPRTGARGVSPLTPIVVTAADGTLAAVTVRSNTGRRVAGSLTADGTSWRSTEPLGYAKTYSVSAQARNADGVPSRARGRFSTVVPARLTLPYLFPGGGVTTVGVGQPVTVRFDEPVADKAAAERALSVRTSRPVVGGWYWFDDQEVHWRPRTYWQPGTEVTVTAKVYGVNVGNGSYGQQDVRSSFRIGPSRIATIDDRTHQMTVRISGRVVRTIPVSLGMGGSYTVPGGPTIYFTTQSGPHVVQEKYRVKRMTSASYGLPRDTPGGLGYDELITDAVRISSDGEFIHNAHWSVDAQGVRNVSHGCVNISPENARWFYSTFGFGDVVDIKNTGVPLGRGVKYSDWMVSWAEWQQGSALA